MPRGSFSSFVDNVAAADSVAQKELRARVAALEQQLLTLGVRPVGSQGVNGPVASFLEEAALSQYSKRIEAAGYHDMETLSSMEEQHFQDLGLLPGHALKMKRFPVRASLWLRLEVVSVRVGALLRAECHDAGGLSLDSGLKLRITHYTTISIRAIRFRTMQGAFYRLLPLLASSHLCQGRFLKRHSEELAVHDQEETCSPLRNHETYSSVPVDIGTPSQTFELVADTGSNNCIVMDCQCAQCPHDWGKCFTGSGKSKTFDLPKYKSHDPLLGSKAEMLPASMLLTFGSGQIAARVASDEVRIGHTHAFMKNGLLLMVDQALSLRGPLACTCSMTLRRHSWLGPAGGQNERQGQGFAEEAGIRRFSMCFNREADGVLGLHTAEPSKRLESVGQIHWGVDFHGISLGEGNAKHRVKICDPKEKRPDQETICGLIPDSGTTMITGPEHQLAELYMDPNRRI
eukprot:s529_g32.t1